jgi:helicase
LSRDDIRDGERNRGKRGDVVARIVRNSPATRDIARRIGIGSAPLCIVCGRGSSGHAGVFLRYLVETRLRLPVSASAPSVITAFRTPLMLRHSLFIVISQSGRSPDLVAATRSARAAGARTIAIVNSRSWPVADEAEFVVPIEAGQEHSVAATKTVIGSMAASYVDVDGTTKTESLVPPGHIIQHRDKPSSQDVIVPLAKQLVAKGEKIIVFRNTRGPAQGCARYLAKELGLGPATDVLAVLPTQDLTAASQDLRLCLQGGTASHNTNLLRAERKAVERGYRAQGGQIHALAATTTLAAGINGPASTVILAENEFVGEDGRPFTIAEYKNMAGRAGRLGFNEIGKAIILADTPVERAQLFQKYVLGRPEDVTSSFKQRDLPTWILRLLSQVRGVRAEDIPGLLANTFGGYSASRANPQWMRQIETDISALVTRLLQAGLAEHDGDLLHLTLLGRACGSSSLAFESSLRLIELMRQLDISRTDPVKVLGIVQVLAEMDAIYTPVMKRGRSEGGSEMVHFLQRYCDGEFEFWARCKRASILYDWLDGVPVDEIERRYLTNPFQGAVNYGDITRIAEGARFHLRSAHQILSALFPAQPAFLLALDELLRRLEFGLPAAALGLMALPVALSRGQYLALFAAGGRSVDTVVTLSPDALENCIGRAAAKRIREIGQETAVA